MDLGVFLLKHLADLKQTDEELAYLVLLTLQGLKPLSRWEKPITDETIKIIEATGLKVERIRRTVKTGDVFETVFSLNPEKIIDYRRAFENKPIDKSPKTQRIEGELFGYPSCCVEKFIEKPYCSNNLTEKDQGLLFHWACPNCKRTLRILPYYRECWEVIRRIR